MKKILFLLVFVLIGSATSHSAETKEPIEFCYSSSDCAIFLFHNNTGEFVVDSDEAFAAVREINTRDFNFGISRVTAEEKNRQAAIARDTQRTLYIENKDLIALQRQGLKAVDSANRCAWNIAGCATASAILAIGKESNKLILGLGLVGAVITCKTSAGDSCTDVANALEEFRVDYKNFLLEHEPPLVTGGGSHGDAHRPTHSSGAGFGTGGTHGGGGTIFARPLPKTSIEITEW